MYSKVAHYWGVPILTAEVKSYHQPWSSSAFGTFVTVDGKEDTITSLAQRSKQSFDNIVVKIEIVENKVDAVRSDLDRLDAKVEDLRTDVKELRVEMKDLRSDVDHKLEEFRSDMRKDLELFRADVRKDQELFRADMTSSIQIMLKTMFDQHTEAIISSRTPPRSTASVSPPPTANSPILFVHSASDEEDIDLSADEHLGTSNRAALAIVEAATEDLSAAARHQQNSANKLGRLLRSLSVRSLLPLFTLRVPIFHFPAAGVTQKVVIISVVDAAEIVFLSSYLYLMQLPHTYCSLAFV